jgi:hypothetical protein
MSRDLRALRRLKLLLLEKQSCYLYMAYSIDVHKLPLNLPVVLKVIRSTLKGGMVYE